MSEASAMTKDIKSFTDISLLKEYLRDNSESGDIIAIKGSRGMALERLIN